METTTHLVTQQDQRYKRTIFLLILLCLAFVVTVIKHLYDNVPVQNEIVEKALSDMRDSLIVHDRVRDSLLYELNSRYKQDSVRISDIRKEVSDIPKTIKSINNSYNEKRNYINSLPVDGQISYMSKWLSSEDSL
jgi:hypothetical protein